MRTAQIGPDLLISGYVQKDSRGVLGTSFRFGPTFKSASGGGKTFLCPVSFRYIFLLALSRLSRSLEQTKASGIERVGISLIQAYDGVGKSITSVTEESMTTLYSWAPVSVCIKNDLKGLQKNFMAVKKSIAIHI